MYFGTHHPRLHLILSFFTIHRALSLQLCDVPACTCGHNFFGPVYFYVSCDVSSPDFNFAHFSIVTEFPLESYELELNSYYARPREPFVIPRDAFAAFVNGSSPPSILGFYNIDNFAPVVRGPLKRLEIQRVAFAGVAMDMFPSEALQDVSQSLLSIYLYNVVPVSADRRAIIFPPVHSLEVLERITIEDTRVSSTTSLIFSSLPSLRQLKITNGYFTATAVSSTSSLLLMDLPSLRSLELSHNNLKGIPPTLSELKTLQSLDLSYNNVISFDADLLKLPELIKIDLRGNAISTINRAELDVLAGLTNLRTLSLAGNPFDCRCDMLPFLRWLQEASLDMGRGGVSCKYPVKFSRIELTAPELVLALETNCSEVVTEKLPGTTEVTSSESLPQTTRKEDVKPGEDSVQYRVVVPITAVTVVVSVAGIVSSLVLHKKLKRRWVGLFRRYSSTSSVSRRQFIHANNNIEIKCRYDAYVCHHDGKAEFVALRMVPQLELQPHNLRLCLSFRDFQVGVDNLDNVSSAMGKSRAIIVLLDREFISSGQCLLELNMACSQMVASVDSVARPATASSAPGCETRLLLVLMDALPVEGLPPTLRALRDKITCLEWDTENEDRCWRQLQNALLATRQSSRIEFATDE